MKHLDTNILIGVTHGCEKCISAIAELMTSKTKIYTSSIAWMEFCNGIPFKAQISALQQSIDTCIPFSQADAETAAKLFLNTGKNKRHLQDCMIAATAINNRATLLTRNSKDFQPFESFGLNLQAI